MRLLQSTWAELLTLTMVFRSLEQLNEDDKKLNNSLKLRYATDYWLDEQLAKDCCLITINSSPTPNNNSNMLNSLSTMTTPTVLDIYNLVSIREKN